MPELDRSTLLHAIAIGLFVLGLIGIVMPGIPGGPLLFAGVLALAWADDFTRIGWPTLVAAGLITILMSVAEWGTTMLGARRSGASRWGIIGGVLGLVVGVFFGLPGILLGPILGAVALESMKSRDPRHLSRVGVGAFIGVVLGAVLKYALAFTMLGIVLLAYWR